jgi:hypothetical protein
MTDHENGAARIDWRVLAVASFLAGLVLLVVALVIALS